MPRAHRTITDDHRALSATVSAELEHGRIPLVDRCTALPGVHPPSSAMRTRRKQRGRSNHETDRCRYGSLRQLCVMPVARTQLLPTAYSPFNRRQEFIQLLPDSRIIFMLPQVAVNVMILNVQYWSPDCRSATQAAHTSIRRLPVFVCSASDIAIVDKKRASTMLERVVVVPGLAVNPWIGFPKEQSFRVVDLFKPSVRSLGAEISGHPRW